MPVREPIAKGHRRILKHAAVAMQQNNRRALANVGIVQADSSTWMKFPMGGFARSARRAAQFTAAAMAPSAAAEPSAIRAARAAPLRQLSFWPMSSGSSSEGNRRVGVQQP